MQQDRTADFDLLERQVVALLEDERSFLANAANFAAFVYTSLPLVNWSGFYFPQADALVLGPFGGKPACTRLPSGRGVCGKAFSSAQTVIVDDVTLFEDHIVCDSASRSEMVVPLLKEGSVYGVFDIDSPVTSRFGECEQRGVERLVRRFMDFTPIPEQFKNDRAGGARIAERIDVQTCREQHVSLQYIGEEIAHAKAPNRALELLSRFRSVLLAHLRLEDAWLYPKLAVSSNPVVREKSVRYRREMGDLRSQFDSLWNRWSQEGAIAADFTGWQSEWRALARDLGKRVRAEDDDLYGAVETDLH